MMKLFVLIFFSLTASGKTLLVSGLDDVLRMGNNTNLFSAALEMTKKDEVFRGMPELYLEILSSGESSEFVLLSGMPSIFKERVESFLTEENFPSHQTYLRSLWTEWSILTFKLRIVSELPNDPKIFILDNSSTSLEFIEAIKDRALVIYSRKVENKFPPDYVISFHTAFDIAYHEYLLGRFKAHQVEKIGNHLLKFDSLIPDYAHCPLDYLACSESEFLLKSVCQKLTQKMKDECGLKTL